MVGRPSWMVASFGKTVSTFARGHLFDRAQIARHVGVPFEEIGNILKVDLPVPHVERREPRIFRRADAVCCRRLNRGFARDASGKPKVARREHEARRQPLDVPFPRSRKGLVEVVDVEAKLRSGVAKPPKLAMWQSPQSCTTGPLTGVAARSRACTIAQPRKNANGDCAMRW